MDKNLIIAEGRVRAVFHRGGQQDIYISYLLPDHRKNPRRFLNEDRNDPNILQFIYPSSKHSVSVGDYVHVEGHMRAGWTPRFGYSQVMIADSIRPCTSDLEKIFGCEGHFSYLEPFRFYLSGVIISQPKTVSDWTNVVVRTSGAVGEAPSAIRLELPPGMLKRLDLLPGDLKPGTFVALVCTIATKIKTEHDRPVRFDNVRVEDIAVHSSQKISSSDSAQRK